MEPKSVDELLFNQNNEPKPANEPIQEPEPESLPEAAEIQHLDSQPEEKPVEAQEVSSDSKIDEYGNPLEEQKQKMYTEEEVNRMMRERASRGRWKEQEQSQQPTQQTQQQPENNPDEPWDVTLEKFVDQAIDKKQKRIAEENWKRQQEQIQAEFEDKFTSGMNRYSDFRKVVNGKNITDSMLLATRHLDNPAAFVYGASKMHPQELERIANISDPYVQAAEVGRLHERMVKSKNLVSNAPRPMDIPKGDMPAKDYSKIPIDQRIHEHALSKQRR